MIFINPDLNALTFGNPWHLPVVVGVGTWLTQVKAYTALSLKNKYTQVQLATTKTTQSVNKYSVMKYHA